MTNTCPGQSWPEHQDTTEPDPRPACPICHHARADWAVCPGCVTRVDHQLGELLDLHALAGNVDALTPVHGEHAAGVRRDPPPPLSIAALDLAIGADILGTLEQWERWWREHWALRSYGQATETLPPTGRPGDRTLAHVIDFLRGWWPRAALVTEPPPEEFADEVRRLHRAAKAALSLIEPRPWTVPCPGDNPRTGALCGYRLEVEYAGRDIILPCPRCGAQWTINRLLLVAESAGRGVWVTIPEAADWVGVHRATVYRAIGSGHVQARYARVDLVSVRHWAAARHAVSGG